MKPTLTPSTLASCHLGAGTEAHELSGALSLEARFPIASVSKTLVALLAARLCHDGAVAWDEPRPVPGEVDARASLRALLQHSAHVSFEFDAAHWGAASLTERELSEASLRPPRLPLPPGTWHYSNLGYALAARMLEEATGRDLATLLADHLLGPLGMVTTSFPTAAEGPLLGAGAPAGDLWSTIGDLITLGQAIDGSRPDVVSWPMVALLLEGAIPRRDGAHLGAGVSTHGVGRHRMVMCAGTIRDRTTCVAIWPRRGVSVLVAEAGRDHDALRQIAARRWDRDDALARTWWWDGQEVAQLQSGDEVDLVLNETTWPFPLFSGRARGGRLVGVGWRGEPLELRERGDALIGAGIRLTAAVADSAATELRP